MRTPSTSMELPPGRSNLTKSMQPLRGWASQPFHFFYILILLPIAEHRVFSVNFSHGFHVRNRCSGRPVPQVRAQPATQAGGQRISTAQKSLPGLSHVHKKSKAAALIVEQATDGTTCHPKAFLIWGKITEFWSIFSMISAMFRPLQHRNHGEIVLRNVIVAFKFGH